MKRAPWLTVLVVAAAMLAIVPSTLAVGEPGTTLYASLGANRFPAGTGVTALGKLQFISEGAIRFDVTINGNQTKLWTARIYSRGSCAAVRNWVANRASTDPAGYLDVMSNAGEVQHQLVPRDVNRVRAALGRGETLALMVAGTDNAGATYRTCTALTSTVPPITTLPPVTTSTTSTSPTSQATSATGTTTTSAATTGSTASSTTQVTTSSTGAVPIMTVCITLSDLPITETFTLPFTITTPTTVTTITTTTGTSIITTTSTSTLPPQVCQPL